MSETKLTSSIVLGGAKGVLDRSKTHSAGRAATLALLALAGVAVSMPAAFAAK